MTYSLKLHGKSRPCEWKSDIIYKRERNRQPNDASPSTRGASPSTDVETPSPATDPLDGNVHEAEVPASEQRRRSVDYDTMETPNIDVESPSPTMDLPDDILDDFDARASKRRRTSSHAADEAYETYDMLHRRDNNSAEHLALLTLGPQFPWPTLAAQRPSPLFCDFSTIFADNFVMNGEYATGPSDLDAASSHFFGYST